MTWIELNEIELPLQSRAPFAVLIFEKCSDNDTEVAPPVAPAVQTVTDNPKDSPLAPQESKMPGFHLWLVDTLQIPSGKHTKNYGKPPCY